MEKSETYYGGCHCQKVRYKITASLEEVIECDCSICLKKGLLHLIVKASDFQLIQGKEALTVYEFNTKTAKHYFCSICGISSYYIPRSHPQDYSINARCLDQFPDIPGLTIKSFSGKNWEENIHKINPSS